MIAAIAIFIAITICLCAIGLYLVTRSAGRSAASERIEALAGERIHATTVSYVGEAENKGVGLWARHWIGEKSHSRVISLLSQAGNPIRVEVLYVICAVMPLAVFFAIDIGTDRLLLAVVMAVGSLLLPFVWLNRRRKKRILAFDKLLPDCVETFARSLRAGHSIASSLGIVAEYMPEPAKSEFAQAFNKQTYGLPMREVLLQMLERVPSDDLRIVITGIFVQSDTGGNLPEVFDRIAEVMRGRISVVSEIRTHTAEGRLTGWILCLLPIVILAAVNIVSPGYSSVLFHDPRGKNILMVGAGLLLIGIMSIRFIISSIEV